MSLPGTFLIGLFSLLSLVTDAALASAADGAVGMVLDVRGSGQITDKGAVGKLQLLAYLKPQMQISLDAGGKASLSLYATRSVYQIAGPAVVEIGKDQLTVIKGAAPVVKSMAEKLVVAAQNTDFRAGATQMRTLPPRILVATPPNGAVLWRNQPTFSWLAMEAAPYDITLKDLSDKVIASATVRESNWRLPANVLLDYGTTYQWTVSYKSATDGRTHSATGEFSLAGKSDVDQLAALKPAEGAPIEEWVLYAAMLQSKGISEEARTVWQSISRQRPDLQRAQELAE